MLDVKKNEKTQYQLAIETITSVMSLFSLLVLTASIAKAETPVKTEGDPSIGQITIVDRLTDVKPTDWAYSALQSLIERYGCISGYPNSTFRGDRSMTRYEFAAGLNACLERINQLVVDNMAVTQEDLKTLQKLQQNFAKELATLQGRVDALEGQITRLEDQQFSTTTKLRGQVIMSVNSGGFDGDRIVDPTGRELTDSNPNTTILYRAGLDLDTSFFGDDLLKIRVETGSGFLSDNGRTNGQGDNAAGFLEPNFGSGIDYSSEPPTDDDIGIGRLFYSFKPVKDLTVSFGPDIRITDYVDRNSYANLSFLDFSTQAFTNNYILFPVDGPNAGAALDWRISETFSLRAVYAAAEASNPSDRGLPIIGTASFTSVLYPDALAPNLGGDRGLFGDTYQGTVELEYAPSRNFALRLQYGGGALFSNHFDAIGANVEYTISPNLGIFARYGFGSYDDTAFGNIQPNYWMAGIASRDLFQPGALAGIAIGQPFIAEEIGDATQTNYEIFYNYPVNRNIQITPSIQVITNAGNQESNGTIVTGTLRTVFSF